MKQTPLIRKAPLTDRWVVITKYREKKGVVEALEKFDVHEQIETIVGAALAVAGAEIAAGFRKVVTSGE